MDRVISDARNNPYEWYEALKKPAWAPPNWLYRPVWNIIYGIIAVSFGTVFVMAFTRQIDWSTVAAPFALNLVLNYYYSRIQFGLRNNLLATIDAVAVVGTLIWGMIAIWPHAQWIAYANIPYLLWCSFATVLQMMVTVLNWNNQ